jgi:choline dehydrogenase
MNWDYLIVGAGSSGCAVANRLSESGNKRILLLEAGDRDYSMAIKVPSAAWICDMKRFDWGYHSASDFTRNQRSEPWTGGRVVGGSSSINGTIYARGSSSDYERWSKMGNYGWGSESHAHIQEHRAL